MVGSLTCLASSCWVPPRPSVGSLWLPECFTKRCLGAKSKHAKTREVEVFGLLRCGPRTWYCRAFTAFYWSGSHKAQTQGKGHKLHFLMGEESDNCGTMF